jgi:hypothetical protein
VPHHKLHRKRKTKLVRHGAFGSVFLRRNRNKLMIEYKVYRMVEEYDSRDAGKTMKTGASSHHARLLFLGHEHILMLE